MSEISLTPSMQANLSALRMISGQLGKIQERLSTGMKVGSAIDNASSYYQSRSLVNRAADLMALLDGMGQGIQTINAAMEGLERGVAFLEQMTATAMQVQEADLVELPKSWFEEQARVQGGVVVANADELKAAVLENKNPPKLIVVYGKIDINLDDVGFNRSILLKDKQKLVGTEYFADINKNALFRKADNRRLSELNITSAVSGRDGIIIKNVSATVSDLTVNGNLSGGVFNAHVSKDTVFHNVDANLKTLEKGLASCLFTYGSKVKMTGTINFRLNGGSDQRVLFINESALEIDADVNFLTQNGKHFWIQGSDGQLTISANSKITAPKSLVFNGLTSASTIFAGAKVGLIETGGFYELLQDFSTGRNYSFTAAGMASDATMFFGIERWELEKDHAEIKALAEASSTLMTSYDSLLNQYDKLLNDTGYDGINLLKKNKLKIQFNERGDVKFDIYGGDMSSAALGLQKAEWRDNKDVAKALSAIADALNSIRSFQSELGNNYQVIQTRQNFTDSLIDVLETGADNLTLADMNEESANYLALQTRQQLSINSLSLAAASAKSILSLF